MSKLTNIKSILIILVVCFLAFFTNSNVIPADLMESRNLATAQEMVHTGNYLIPTMNGELRLEKPPLPTWIAAGVEQIFPDNLSLQRCVAASAATMLIIFLFLIVRKLTKNDLLALISALVLATCYNIIIIGRTATWDIYCHSFMLGAIYFLISAVEKKGKQWGYFSLAGIFMGLSFLSKGPVSFYALLLPFIISYVIVLRPQVKDKILPLCVMVIICLLLSFWWPVYIAVFHPEVGIAVAGKESSAWLNHNVRPLWYYLQFPGEAGIWALFWITSLAFYWKQRKRRMFRFSIVWMVAGLILLSLIPEKKVRYLLPILIPGAINIAFYISYSIKSMTKRREKVIFQINGMLIVLITTAIPFALYLLFTGRGVLSWPVFVITSLAFLGLAIYMAIALFGKKGVFPLKLFSGVVLTMLVFIVFCFAPVSRLFINEQRHSIHILRNEPRISGLPFYHDKNEVLRMELVYEANRNITSLDMTNDSLFYANLPFVLVSAGSAQEVLVNKNVSIEYIDTFDNNWRKPDSKRYNRDLVRQVAIIKALR